MKTASRMCHSSLFELLCSFCAPIVLFLAILKWLLLCADKRNHFSLKFENVYYVTFIDHSRHIVYVTIIICPLPCEGRFYRRSKSTCTQEAKLVANPRRRSIGGR